jgi:hypothetical protein
VTYSIAATHSASPCKQTRRVSCAGTKRIPSFAREGVTGRPLGEVDELWAADSDLERRLAETAVRWLSERGAGAISTPDLPVELAPRLDLAGADEFSVVRQSLRTYP